ncbi:MAG: hypothetical protein AAFU57_18495 [Bacteroidota bacterium]
MAIRSTTTVIGAFPVKDPVKQISNNQDGFDARITWLHPEGQDPSALSYRVLMYKVIEGGSLSDELVADSGLITSTQVDFTGPFEKGRTYTIVVQTYIGDVGKGGFAAYIIEDVIK